MLLVPFDSIDKSLITILPHWEAIMVNGNVPDSLTQHAYRNLLNDVFQYTHTVANHGLDSPSELAVIKRSPYKPFGTFMFCSSEGAACIDNSETILKILHLTMKSYEKCYDNIIQDCFSEHIAYDSVLNHTMEKIITGRRIAKSDSESSTKIEISLQLKAIGVDSAIGVGHQVIFNSLLQ